MAKVVFQTHGCSANLSESEGMAGLLHTNGHSIVKNQFESDVIILNTCTVKGEERMITEFNKLRRMHPKKKMVIAGCVTQLLIDTIRSLDPTVSILNTNNMRHVVDVVNGTVQGLPITQTKRQKESKVNLPRVRHNPLIGIIPILNSCLGSCTFCSTKIVKGNLFSFPEIDILKECIIAIQQGCKELQLTSQDNGCYGKEDGESMLPELVEKMAALPGEFMIRIGMMNPEHILPIIQNLIQVLCHPNVYKFVHIPVQAGSNQVLQNMKREYTIQEFTMIVDTLRRAIPNLTIATDIICGFPTETHDDFEKTVRMLKTLQIDVVNISRFKIREGTLSAKMKQLPGNIIKKRTNIVTEVCRKISEEKNRRWRGWKGQIVVTEHGKHSYQGIGRNDWYKPVIVKNPIIGERISVEVRSSNVYSLFAE